MLVSKANDIVQVLLDKYGSPNVIDSESIDFINLAINEKLNRLFPDSQGGVVNFELDSNVTANIQPLIWTISTTMNGSGVVTNTVINSALATATGNVDSEYFRISSIGMTSSGVTYPVKYLKQNNRWTFERNTFKQPTVTNARFTLLASGLQLYPTAPTTTLIINLIKKPIVLTTANLADEMEFSDYETFNIIALAVKAAGVSIRDSEVLEDSRLAALQIMQ